jgi:hypothetical protein
MGSGAELMADYVDQVSRRATAQRWRASASTGCASGDIVLVRDQDHTWGRGYFEGGHDRSDHPRRLGLGRPRAGRPRSDVGPRPAIVAVPDTDANIAWRLGLRDPADEAIRAPGAVSSYAGIETSKEDDVRQQRAIDRFSSRGTSSRPSIRRCLRRRT